MKKVLLLAAASAMAVAFGSCNGTTNGGSSDSIQGDSATVEATPEVDPFPCDFPSDIALKDATDGSWALSCYTFYPNAIEDGKDLTTSTLIFYSTDKTKYGEGTEGTFRIRIGEFQLKVIIRLDSETARIKRDDRFIIDVDPKYFHDTDNLQNGYDSFDIIPSVYKVTRRNVVTGTFPDIGYIELTLSEDQFVAGYDSLSDMIACKVSDIVKIDDSEQGTSDGSTEESSDSNENNGGWL